MDERKRSEVFAFFWFVVSVLTFLALFSYRPEDIAFEVSVPNSPTHNFVGIAGAYVAWTLTFLFGKTSYFLVPLFLIWALVKLSGKKSQRLWLKILSTVIFFTSTCALFSLVGRATEIDSFQSGGFIGFFVASFLSALFGDAGIFVALSLFLLSVILTTELLVLQMAVELFNRVKSVVNPILTKKNPKTSLKNDPTVKPAFLMNMKLALPRENLPSGDKKSTQRPADAKPQIRVSMPKPAESKPAMVEAPKPKVIEDQAAQGSYRLPSLDILQTPPVVDSHKVKGDLEESSRVLEDTLRDFGIDAKVVEVEQGPTITRYELQPAAGVKVQRPTPFATSYRKVPRP